MVIGNMLVDTHCHLDMIESSGISIDQTLQKAVQNGLSGLVQIAVDISSSIRNQKLIENFQKSSLPLHILWTAGLHPESVKNKGQITEIIQWIRKSSDDSFLAGIGETGLDFFQAPETKEIQIESLYEHMKLAKELDLPLIVHCRDTKQYQESQTEAIQLIYQIAKELNFYKGIMHCFTYSYREAQWFIELDWKISFSGILTFKNATFIQEAAKNIPVESILIETDSPFLSPVPVRGKTNQPSHVIYVLEFLSHLRRTPEEILKEKLYWNTKNIFTKFP